MVLAVKKMMIWLGVVTAALMMSGPAAAQGIAGTDTGLGGANSITGTVLSPTGQRTQRGISIRLISSTKGDRIAVTDETGNFAFRGLPNGDYQLVIDKEKEYEALSQTVSVFQMRGAPGGIYNVSLRLKNKPGTDSKPAVVNAELSEAPEKARSLFNAGQELAEKGDPKGAIDQFKLAIAEHPKFVSAYNNLGVQYLKLNDIARANDAFRSALNINPHAFDPLLNHGIVMYTIQRYADAEAALREALKQKEGSATGHFFLGQTLANLGKFDEAEKELLTGLRLGGEERAKAMREGHRLLAIIYHERGDKKRQAAQLEVYLKLAPDAADAEQLKDLLARLRSSN